MIKNPNKRKIINLSVVLLLCILFIISLILNNKSNNNELLSTTESLVTDAPETKGCGCGNNHEMDNGMSGMY